MSYRIKTHTFQYKITSVGADRKTIIDEIIKAFELVGEQYIYEKVGTTSRLIGRVAYHPSNEKCKINVYYDGTIRHDGSIRLERPGYGWSNEKDKIHTVTIPLEIIEDIGGNIHFNQIGTSQSNTKRKHLFSMMDIYTVNDEKIDRVMYFSSSNYAASNWLHNAFLMGSTIALRGLTRGTNVPKLTENQIIVSALTWIYSKDIYGHTDCGGFKVFGIGCISSFILEHEDSIIYNDVYGFKMKLNILSYPVIYAVNCIGEFSGFKIFFTLEDKEEDTSSSTT